MIVLFCSEATLTFINIDVTATRAVVVFADCHRKLLPSFVSSKELIDDLEKILPGEVRFFLTTSRIVVGYQHRWNES